MNQARAYGLSSLKLFCPIVTLGDANSVREYVLMKVGGWKNSVHALAEAAKTYPLTAPSAFTYSLCMEWTYVQRVTKGHAEDYLHLRQTICKDHTPALFGREILESEHYPLAGVYQGVQLAPPQFSRALEKLQDLLQPYLRVPRPGQKFARLSRPTPRHQRASSLTTTPLYAWFAWKDGDRRGLLPGSSDRSQSTYRQGSRYIERTKP